MDVPRAILDGHELDWHEFDFDVCGAATVTPPEDEFGIAEVEITRAWVEVDGVEVEGTGPLAWLLLTKNKERGLRRLKDRADEVFEESRGDAMTARGAT